MDKTTHKELMELRHFVQMLTNEMKDVVDILAERDKAIKDLEKSVEELQRLVSKAEES